MNEGKPVRCAIYCRKSTDENLDSDFNSLDNQRERAESYIHSQADWVALPERYDDGGYSGATTERPALQKLLTDMEEGKLDCIVVYRTDRLSRSILDFLRLLERIEAAGVAYVSVTEAFSTRTPAGRLMLHLLLSFAQYERELVSERTRHKIAGAKRKGRWCGGTPILGYDIDHAGGRLVVNEAEAEQVRAIFQTYLRHDGLIPTVKEVNTRGWTSKRWRSKKGVDHGGTPFLKNTLHHMLTNVTYVGKVKYQGEIYPGEHPAIVDEALWLKVQEKLKTNGRNGGSGQRNKHAAMLKALLVCGSCGSAMTCTYTQSIHKRYRYYKCSTSQKRGAAACPSGALPAAEIESFVLGEIERVVKPDAIAEAVRQVRGEGGEARRRSAPALADLSPVQKEQLARLLIERVAYDGEKGEVSITFREGVPAAKGATA